MEYCWCMGIPEVDFLFVEFMITDFVLKHI